MKRLRFNWMQVGGGVVAMHLTAAPVWAQKFGRIPNEDSGWLQWGIAAGIAVVVCVTAFINSKRSHLA